MPVVGESRAGSRDVALLPSESVMRVFTGAPLGPGADAVVMQEDVTREGDVARFRSRPSQGAHVRKRGEDLAKGDVAIARGTRMRAAHVALAASLDRAWVYVARRPIVAIVGTGNELRPHGSPGAPGSIAESNGCALRAMVYRAGGLARVARFVEDDARATERALAEGLDGSDVMITIGGVSVGEHDLVRPALEKVGVSLDFWKVAIKPGKPLAVGRRGRSVVLGLPGNPVSALVTFALLGAPLLRAMQGDREPIPAPRRGRLTRSVRHAPGRLELVRATLAYDAAGLNVTPLANQASGAPVSLARADALACIPADSEEPDVPKKPKTASLSTHLTARGDVHMIDVGAKVATHRRAVAKARVSMARATFERLRTGDTPKGDVLATVRLAGIQAAKRTPELIPLCHVVALTRVTIEVVLEHGGVTILAATEARDRTGVEMEALVAANVAALALYDMLKGIDRGMRIACELLRKEGGKTGTWTRGDR
jgi:molybdopterin molybdotransferase